MERETFRTRYAVDVVVEFKDASVHRVIEGRPLMERQVQRTVFQRNPGMKKQDNEPADV